MLMCHRLFSVSFTCIFILCSRLPTTLRLKIANEIYIKWNNFHFIVVFCFVLFFLLQELKINEFSRISWTVNIPHILLQMHKDFQFYIIMYKFNARWHFTKKKFVALYSRVDLPHKRDTESKCAPHRNYHVATSSHLMNGFRFSLPPLLQQK